MNPINTQPRATVVLEHASLEIHRLGSKDVLLNSDDHWKLLSRLGKPSRMYRPDIVHQCLLTLLDSPLNKAGKLKVYVHTKQNVLIDIHPHIRIPRTYSRFAGLIIQLLQKRTIHGDSSSEPLLRIIKNPITKYIPQPYRIMGFSAQGRKINIHEYVQTMDPSVQQVFVIGAMSHGEDSFGNIDEYLSISEYDLAASTVCGKVCYALEHAWNSD